MNQIDLFDEDHDGYQRRAFAAERERRRGLNEDDDSCVAPYIGILPEESETEEGSPLDFGNDAHTSAGSYFRENAGRWSREERRLQREMKETSVEFMGIRGSR
jgi:hypothetical protein